MAVVLRFLVDRSGLASTSVQSGRVSLNAGARGRSRRGRTARDFCDGHGREHRAVLDVVRDESAGAPACLVHRAVACADC